VTLPSSYPIVTSSWKAPPKVLVLQNTEVSFVGLIKNTGWNFVPFSFETRGFQTAVHKGVPVVRGNV